MTDVLIEQILGDLLWENILLFHNGCNKIIKDQVLNVLRQEFEDFFFFNDLIEIGEPLKILSMDSSGIVHLLLELLE